MLILVLGVALWWAAHLWKRVAPNHRARFGDAGKGIVAAALVVSILMMIWGYRHASGSVWWGPTPMTKGINNLLVLMAVYLFAAAGMKTRIGVRLRHPQLIGFSLWAFAHFLVNGSVEGIVLFEGLLIWALYEISVINRAEPEWSPPDIVVPARKEWIAIGATLIVYVVIGTIHGWIGPSPWGA